MRAVVKRVKDFTYTGVLYSKFNLRSKTFDCSNVSFSATGQYLSIPGEYEVKIMIIPMNSTKEIEAAKYTVNVLKPVADKEVRYLPFSDEVYIRADINEKIGQKSENQWPNVWVGVYDLDASKWLYLKPDANNKLNHIGFNKYEMYFSGAKLVRGHRLKFMILVDGYNVPEGIKSSSDDVLTLTPTPKAAWDVRYNYKNDEIEAVIQPDRGSSQDYYLVVFDENDVPLYGFHNTYRESLTEIPKYTYKDTRYIGKYFKSWNALGDLLKYSVKNGLESMMLLKQSAGNSITNVRQRLRI